MQEEIGCRCLIRRWRLQAGCAAWTGAVCGLDSGVFATAVSLVGEKTGWADLAISTFAGIGFFGTFLATIFGGKLADGICRKRLILFGLALYFFGALGLVAGAAVPALLFAGRLLSGAGLGFLYLATPLYLAEMAAVKSRGRRVGLFQFLLVVGILLGAVCVLGCHQAWICFALPGLLSAWLAFLLVWLPEDDHAGSRRMARVPMSALLKSRGIWLALAVGALVPLSGIGPVLDYSVTLFKRAGLNGLGANGVDVLIKGVNLAMTFPALFLADRIGRRTLMIAGSLVMTIALAVTSFSFWSGGAVGALLAAFGCVIYIAAFAIGPGVCMWLVIPESLSADVRAMGMSVALLVDYAAVTVIITGFLPFTTAFGLAGGFALLAFFSAALFSASVFWLKETKGKEL